MPRRRLIVLVGGQSAEHDVSCTSARHVLAAIDPAKYAVEPVGISRDGEWVRAEDAIAASKAQDDEVLAIHEVLDRLAKEEPRKAEVVKLRYFVGMTIEETAEALDISTPTAKRDWTYARAWLYRELGEETES